MAMSLEYPMAPDGTSLSSLHRLAENGGAARLKQLLTNDNMVAGAKNQNGWTPLTLTARNGQENFVAFLIEQCSAEVNVKNNHAQTPLSWAARNGHEVTVKLLLDEGNIDINLGIFTEDHPCHGLRETDMNQSLCFYFSIKRTLTQMIMMVLQRSPGR